MQSADCMPENGRSDVVTPASDNRIACVAARPVGRQTVEVAANANGKATVVQVVGTVYAFVIPLRTAYGNQFYYTLL